MIFDRSHVTVRNINGLGTRLHLPSGYQLSASQRDVFVYSNLNVIVYDQVSSMAARSLLLLGMFLLDTVAKCQLSGNKWNSIASVSLSPQLADSDCTRI